jgi:PAS domain S-box-containing protein
MKKLKIMVVEDEGIVAADIQDRLVSLGYEVSSVVHSGEEAEPKAKETKPDLVLMDIKLGGNMDGVDAAQRIQRRLDIPVVYLTAHGDEATLRRAKVTEPFGYVLKPFDERSLHTNIEIALYRHKAERRLKNLEQWIEAVLRSIGDAVVVTDRWGLITMMNPAASRLTGWPLEEALSTPIAEVFKLFDPETRKPVLTPINKVILEEVIIDWRNPMLHVSRDASETLVDYSAAPVRDESEDVTGIVLSFHGVNPNTVVVPTDTSRASATS